MFRDRQEAAERLAERLTQLRGMNPLVLAIPRGGVPMGRVIADTLAHLETLADEVICLQAPRHFQAVGQSFADFTQIEDEDVMTLLTGT